MRTLLLAALFLTLAACKDSTTSTTTAPSANPVVERLEDAGHNLKAAATQAVEQAKPAWNAAKEKSREAVHTAAEKVAEWTATQPAAR